MSTRKHLWLWPASLTLSLALAPAFAAQRAAPKATATAAKPPASGRPSTASSKPVASSRPSTTAAKCYTPPVRRGAKIAMSALPPPGICLGTQIKEGGVLYCYNCGTSNIRVGGGCVSCNAGYTWNAASQSCCKGAGPSLPTPK